MPDKKIKIALMSYVVDGRRGKGTALYAQKLIEQMLSDERFDFYLVHYKKSDEPIYARAKEIIMPRIRLPYGSHFISQLLFFWKYRNDKFDIIHWFQPRVYPFFGFAPARKIVVTMHGAGDITAPNSFVFSRTVFNFVLKYFHDAISMVIVVSNNAKEEIVKYYNFSYEKISVIYNGGGETYRPINKTEAKKVVNKKYNIEGSYILDISRLLPHKNVSTLIKSYILYREKNPSGIEKLVIVGSQMNNQTEEYLIAKKSNYSKDIIFISYVHPEDLNAIYSASDLFVFPSLTEGFGLPILEAMASGIPVITSNVTSMPEIGGDAVVIIDPLNVVELSNAITNILSNESLREEMIKKGLARSKDFTWSKMVEKTKNLYIDLCKV